MTQRNANGMILATITHPQEHNERHQITNHNDILTSFSRRPYASQEKNQTELITHSILTNYCKHKSDEGNTSPPIEHPLSTHNKTNKRKHLQNEQFTQTTKLASNTLYNTSKQHTLQNEQATHVSGYFF